jgi:hypothetical protein
MLHSNDAHQIESCNSEALDQMQSDLSITMYESTSKREAIDIMDGSKSNIS